MEITVRRLDEAGRRALQTCRCAGIGNRGRERSGFSMDTKMRFLEKSSLNVWMILLEGQVEAAFII